MIKEGDEAPNIHLEDDKGHIFDLASHRGKRVIVYFYPKADTPGCTTEACEFRDSSPRITHKDAIVVGVSPDTVSAQARFRGKFELNFPLLADVDKRAAEAYGVYQEKNMYGKKSMGIVRSTFIVGPDGKVEKVFAKVKAQGHANQVLAALPA